MIFITDLERQPSIIYIAGYGRSGSTLLDILLNNHPKISSLGEIKYIYDQVVKKDICSCGMSFDKCQFWAPVLNDLSINKNDFLFALNSELKKMDGWKGLLKKLINKNINKRQYKELQQEILTKISEYSNSQLLIDSSKTSYDAAGRPAALFGIGCDVKIIHLIRDPRGVLWSTLKGSNKKLEDGIADKPGVKGFVKALLGWQTANIAALLNKKIIGKEKYLSVRYEDLVENPFLEIKRISDFLNMDLSCVIEAINNQEEINVGHNIGGNRVARTKKITLKPDYAWKENLTGRQKKVTWLLLLPLVKKFGYSLK